MRSNYKEHIIIIDALIGNDYALCLSSAVSDDGVNVSLVVPENRTINRTVNPYILKWIPSKDPSRSKLKKILTYAVYFGRLISKIIKEKPSAVHFQFFRTRLDVLLFLIIKLLPVKLVYTAHNILPHEHKKSDKLINSLVYKTADKIIVHSDYIKQKLSSTFNVKQQKIEVIPHGSFDHYLPETFPDRTLTRQSFGINRDDKIILFFGYIREYKGLDLLLEAFREVKQQCSEIKLLIAGSPQTEQLKTRYEQHIKSISANGSIITHFSFIPDNKVADYFVSADLVVLPYKAIDHSGLIHLAYSFGKPVIATKVGDFVETVINGKTGYLINNTDPKELARVIISSLDNTNELERMGANAKKLSDTLYSWDKIAEQTINLYRTA